MAQERYIIVEPIKLDLGRKVYALIERLSSAQIQGEFKPTVFLVSEDYAETLTPLKLYQARAGEYIVAPLSLKPVLEGDAFNLETNYLVSELMDNPNLFEQMVLMENKSLIRTANSLTLTTKICSLPVYDLDGFDRNQPDTKVSIKL